MSCRSCLAVNRPKKCADFVFAACLNTTSQNGQVCHDFSFWCRYRTSYESRPRYPSNVCRVLHFFTLLQTCVAWSNKKKTKVRANELVSNARQLIVHQLIAHQIIEIRGDHIFATTLFSFSVGSRTSNSTTAQKKRGNEPTSERATTNRASTTTRTERITKQGTRTRIVASMDIVTELRTYSSSSIRRVQKTEKEREMRNEPAESKRVLTASNAMQRTKYNELV